VVPIPTALEDALQPSCVLFIRDLCDYGLTLLPAAANFTSRSGCSQAVPDATKHRDFHSSEPFGLGTKWNGCRSLFGTAMVPRQYREW